MSVPSFFKALILLAVVCALSSCIGIFAKAERGTILDLVDSEWVLSEMNSSKINTDRRPTLKFNEGPSISGFSGCNRYASSANLLTESSLSLSSISSTKRACRNKVMEFESSYMSALGRVSGWSIRRHSLRLLDKGGNTLLRFRRMGAQLGTNI
jgi:heat shock protein HslJ